MINASTQRDASKGIGRKQEDPERPRKTDHTVNSLMVQLAHARDAQAPKGVAYEAGIGETVAAQDSSSCRCDDVNVLGPVESPEGDMRDVQEDHGVV